MVNTQARDPNFEAHGKDACEGERRETSDSWWGAFCSTVLRELGKCLRTIVVDFMCLWRLVTSAGRSIEVWRHNADHTIHGKDSGWSRALQTDFLIFKTVTESIPLQTSPVSKVSSLASHKFGVFRTCRFFVLLWVGHCVALHLVCGYAPRTNVPCSRRST